MSQENNTLVPYFHYSEGSSASGQASFTIVADGRYQYYIRGVNFNFDRAGVVPDINIGIENYDLSRFLTRTGRDSRVYVQMIKPNEGNIIGKNKYYPSSRLHFGINAKGIARFYLESADNLDFNYQACVFIDRVEVVL